MSLSPSNTSCTRYIFEPGDLTTKRTIRYIVYIMQGTILIAANGIIFLAICIHQKLRNRPEMVAVAGKILETSSKCSAEYSNSTVCCVHFLGIDT